MRKIVDPVFRVPRIWSNDELRRFSGLFVGSVVNVSGWRDEDKQGGRYRDYFSAARNYSVSNYESKKRGFTGLLENEFFLDLTEPLDEKYCAKFEVAFSHTVFEHIFPVQFAFENFCRMTKDIAIIVVPFLQQEHADYGDYWRFTPQVIDKLFSLNGFKTLYINFNTHKSASIYVFAIASRYPERWESISRAKMNKILTIYDPTMSPRPGEGVIQRREYASKIRRLFNKLKF